jgi:hypothetical protein
VRLFILCSPEQSVFRDIACIFVACICRVNLSLSPKLFCYYFVYVKLNRTDAIEQFPCGRVKRFLKNNTQNKMRVGAKGTILISPGPKIQPQLTRV